MKALTYTLVRLTRALSEVFEKSDNPEEILHALLSAITAGESLGFNRAFVMLFDENGDLTGYMATGPVSPEEADRIWRDLEEKKLTLEEIINSYSPERVEEHRKKFAFILQHLKCTKEELNAPSCIIGKALNSQKASLISVDEIPEIPDYIKILGSDEIAIVPLEVGRKKFGIILADNFITKSRISKTTLLILESFALQASTALSKAYYVKEMQNKIRELEEKNRLIQEYHRRTLELEKIASIGNLVYHLAHEFKNPIVVIGGLARAMLDDTPEEDPRRPFVEAIIEEITKLDRILHSTVQGLRHKAFTKRERVDLLELIDKKIHDLGEYARTHSVNIQFYMPKKPIYLNLPRETFEDVIENLLTNAIDAMPEGGTVEVWIEREKEKINVYFRDNGTGIPRELQPKIFDPFFTTKKKGSGLGLYNVRQILKGLGGDIELIESIPNKGTTFRIYLPEVIP